MTLLRPRTGTEFNFNMKPRWPSRDDQCGVCRNYGGLHARCWWYWLTEERVIRGASDGEQQIEPDEPHPSRLWMFVRMTRTQFSPGWWWLCWRERISPWVWDV